MARYLFLLAPFLLIHLPLIAQESPPFPQCPPPLSKEDTRPSDAPDPGKPDKVPGKMREWMKQLPEEERQKFIKNFQQWQQMGEEEKRHFRERTMMDRQKIQEAIDDALKKADLNLDKDRREVFGLRYMQERKKIEKGLREEMEVKRNKLLEGVVGQLKKEFQSYSLKKEDTDKAADSAKKSEKEKPSPQPTP